MTTSGHNTPPPGRPPASAGPNTSHPGTGEVLKQHADDPVLEDVSTSRSASSTGPPDPSGDHLSPGAVADRDRLSPYPHLSDHLSDSYDGFSDYDYTTPGFGDDFSEIAGLPPMASMEGDQDDLSVAATNETQAPSDVTSKLRTPSTGDSVTHPSTRLLSPVPTNPSISRASTARDLSADETSGGRNAPSVAVSPSPFPHSQGEARGESVPVDGAVSLDALNRDAEAGIDDTDARLERYLSPTELHTHEALLPGTSTAPVASTAATAPTPASLAQTSPSPGDKPGDLPDVAPMRRGINPMARGKVNEASIPTLDEQQKERELATTKAGVKEWLASADTTGRENPNVVNNVVDKGIRPKAAKPSVESQSPNAPTPGPGVFVNQEDDDDSDDDDDNEDALENSEDENEDDTTPPAPYNMVDPSPSETSAAARWPQRPWADSPFEDDSSSIRGQPMSSSAAMAHFERRARDLETASVTATIASSRRRSLESLFSAANISVMPPSEASNITTTGISNTRERRPSFLDRILPKRNTSNLLKRKDSQENEHTSSGSNAKTNTYGSLSPPRPVQTSGRPKSPSLTASNDHTPPPYLSQQQRSATTLSPSPGIRNSVTNVIRRARSRSDLSQHSALAQQWASAGGPPVANLRPPSQDPEPEKSLDRQNSLDTRDPEMEADGDGDHTPTGVFDMSLGPLKALSAPTPDSFKAHAHEANPHIQAYMLERVTSEQLKRYRRLVESRLKHAMQVDRAQCTSGDCCSVLGSGPKMLEPRKTSVDSENPAVTFYINRAGSPSDAAKDDDSIAANFPEGIPLPPAGVHRLPAEFECPLCFQVKKILKPSDWTKHVHEDLQPFTCSFPECGEPKSFKRKADWVRHENERHRQLDEWICNVPDCQHICYRKDNFVQHLVREHKLPEPRVRAPKSAGNMGMQDSGQVARLVEICRHNTDRRPQDEACRFCGNYLTSWKKLSAHLAKHMEHISLPVLALAHQVELRQDAVLSPADQGFNFSKRGQKTAGWNQSLDNSSKGFSAINSVQEPRNGQYEYTSTAQSSINFQTHGDQSAMGAYSAQPTQATQDTLRPTPQSYPGSSNVRRRPSPFVDQPLYQPTQYLEQSYMEASPSDAYPSGFDSSLGHMPVSQSQAVSMTYPPAFMSSNTSQPQEEASFVQGAPYHGQPIYGSAFGQGEFNTHPNSIPQPAYQYTSAPNEGSNLHFAHNTGGQYPGGVSSHTPTAPLPHQNPAQYNSLTPTSQYARTPTQSYSTSTSPFPQLHEAYVQPQHSRGGSAAGQHQYVAPALGADIYSSSSSPPYAEQVTGTDHPGMTHFSNEQQQEQQRRQQGQYGAYFGS